MKERKKEREGERQKEGERRREAGGKRETLRQAGGKREIYYEWTRTEGEGRELKGLEKAEEGLEEAERERKRETGKGKKVRV